MCLSLFLYSPSVCPILFLVVFLVIFNVNSLIKKPKSHDEIGKCRACDEIRYEAMTCAWDEHVNQRFLLRMQLACRGDVEVRNAVVTEIAEPLVTWYYHIETFLLQQLEQKSCAWEALAISVCSKLVMRAWFVICLLQYSTRQKQSRRIDDAAVNGMLVSLKAAAVDKEVYWSSGHVDELFVCFSNIPCNSILLSSIFVNLSYLPDENEQRHRSSVVS